MNIKLFPITALLIGTYLTGAGLGSTFSNPRIDRPSKKEARYASFWSQCYDEDTNGILPTDYCLEVGKTLKLVKGE